MRIVGGAFRGRALTPVGKGDPAAHLRPTADRVRESLFNILSAAFGMDFEGVRVLDLFAGTGALGLEALSRGAERVTFVEQGRKARTILTKNVALLGVCDRVRLLRADATRLGGASEAYELLFLDPPYGRQMGERALVSALAGGWLAPSALVVWEENAAPNLPPGLELRDQRRYGDTLITIAEHVAQRQ